MEHSVTWSAKTSIPKGSTDEQRDDILNAVIPAGDNSDDALDQLGDCCNACTYLIEDPTETAVVCEFTGEVGKFVRINITF